jgi:soluble lytic murein transglycosylase-like protein
MGIAARLTRAAVQRAIAPMLASALAMACPCAARADVMQIGDQGPNWISGGPAPAPLRHPAPKQGQAPDLYAAPSGSTMPRAWIPVITRLAATYDISPRLIEAVIWQESRWRVNAVSPAGARGLAQLMPSTAKALGVNPDDPVANVEAGTRYLRSLIDTFDGNIEKALAAYNAGPARVARAGGVPAIRETRNYISAIYNHLAEVAK